MEWVTTTGRSVEDATEVLLDQLGVAADEADIEVLEEPKAVYLAVHAAKRRFVDGFDRQKCGPSATIAAHVETKTGANSGA